MSKKLLPNRISKVVTPEMRAKVQQAFQLLDEALGTSTPISEDDYKSLRKIADKMKSESDDVFAITELNADLLEEPLTVVEITKDKDFYEFCDAIRAAKKSFEIKLDREQNVAGSEYFNACCIFEEDVKTRANRGSTKAQNVKAQLDAIDRNRNGGNISNAKRAAKTANLIMA
jgi:hypothetical protein